MTSKTAFTNPAEQRSNLLHGRFFTFWAVFYWTSFGLVVGFLCKSLYNFAPIVSDESWKYTYPIEIYTFAQKSVSQDWPKLGEEQTFN